MIRNHSSSQGARALTALLLFVFGSNYCIVSAYASADPGRTGITCHIGPAASATHESATCCRGRTAGERSAPPAVKHGSPCCMALSTVSSPELHRDELPSSLWLVVPPNPAPLLSTAVSASRPPHREHRAGPLASSAGGPLALRAPPQI